MQRKKERNRKKIAMRHSQCKVGFRWLRSTPLHVGLNAKLDKLFQEMERRAETDARTTVHTGRTHTIDLYGGSIFVYHRVGMAF